MAGFLLLLPLMAVGATCHSHLSAQWNSTHSLNLIQMDARKVGSFEKQELHKHSKRMSLESSLFHKQSLKQSHKRSFDRNDPPVAFLHIPKTAGSTIEEVGFHDFEIRWSKYRLFGMIPMPDGYACSAHHVPPQYAPGEIKGMYATRDQVFCVTRNPYERAVSEYTYLLSAPKGQIDNETGLIDNFECTPEGLNNFVQKAMAAVTSGKKFIADCHFLPQSEYIWEGDRQWCKNILRMDGLPGNFNTFMESLGLSVRLGKDRKNAAAHRCPGVSVASLTHKTKAMLNQVYHDDFVKLGYSIGTHK